jgi:hypothetical protein
MMVWRDVPYMRTRVSSGLLDLYCSLFGWFQAAILDWVGGGLAFVNIVWSREVESVRHCPARIPA